MDERSSLGAYIKGVRRIICSPIKLGIFMVTGRELYRDKTACKVNQEQDSCADQVGETEGECGM